MAKFKRIILIIILLISITTFTYAIDEELMQSQQDSLNISSFIKESNEYTKENFPDIDVQELLNSAIRGEVDNSTLIKKIISLLGGEVLQAIKLLGMILVIIVIGSILKTIGENLGNQSISQITYYVQYILIVTLILSNFTDIIDIARTTIQDLSGFMNSLVPILMTLMVSTGSIVSASIAQPIILFAISFITNIISTIVLPLVLVATILGIVSNISDKIQIGRLSKYFKSSIVWGLGIILTIFVGMLSLEGTLSSSIDGITAKTTKAAVSNLIPVVGKILGDSIDTVLGCAVILKNAVGIVGVIVLISICVMPIIKLGILTITYSIAAAIAEPIADGKIVKLLEQFADTFKLLLGIIFAVSAMFLIGVTIVIKMSNSGIMYR